MPHSLVVCGSITTSVLLDEFRRRAVFPFPKNTSPGKESAAIRLRILPGPNLLVIHPGCGGS